MPYVLVCGQTGVGVTVAKTRKAAEDRLLIEAESRGWGEHLGDDPLADVLVTKVLKRNFFDCLGEAAQRIYNRGLGVVWPLHEQVMDLGPEAKREYEAMIQEAIDKGQLKTGSGDSPL